MVTSNMKKVSKKQKYIGACFIFSIITLLLISIISNPNISQINKNKSEKVIEENTPKISAIMGDLHLHANLTINTTRHGLGKTIPIRGNVTHLIWGPREGYNVSLIVDDVFIHKFNDTTDVNGEFLINFTIPNSLDVYSSHKIEVNVTDPLVIRYFGDHYMIDVNANSTILMDWINSDDPSVPLIPGESFYFEGHLNYADGKPLSGRIINKYWKNSTDEWANGTLFTLNSPNAGKFSENLKTPNVLDLAIFYEDLTLKLNYSGQLPQINSSELIIALKLFNNITCNWKMVDKTSEGETITIYGHVASRTNPNLPIRGKNVNIYYDNQHIGTRKTDATGNFTMDYIVPPGTGYKNITIQVVHTLVNVSIISDTYHFINVSIAVGGQDTEVPITTGPLVFQGFFIIFIPVIAGVVAVLVFVGIKFLKKQEEESKSVQIPLASKIKNMKILKESGRLEEALSYLFNAIYMELVSAKYNRTKKPFETIRDFAIVSVKELKLSPTTIYPFIQKVEGIIYGRPYSITDRDFYDTVGLFSPIYYELTGYNFILKF